MSGVCYVIRDDHGRPHSYHDTPEQVRHALENNYVLEELPGILVSAYLEGKRVSAVGAAEIDAVDWLLDGPLRFTGQVAEDIAAAADNRKPRRGTTPPVEES